MSKIGKQPIKILEGVNVSIAQDKLTITGPKGTLTELIRPEMEIKVLNGQIFVMLKKQSLNPKVLHSNKALHGLVRSIIANMVKGVTVGFTKVLELHGVGYRAVAEANNLKLSLGFSHPVIIESGNGIQFKVEANNLIKIMGVDKQQVGQMAAKIRAVKPPEPYKGKGIRYKGEIIKKKAGKAAKVGGATA